MTLLEMSSLYADSAARIRVRIAELRAEEKNQTNPEAARQLQQRINALIPILREMRELSVLTAHYYDRSFHKYERYTL